ncbi:Arm DNA-binding domain-containing protein [Peribacillus asahii]|uniref:Arm DNA-binding domain-containing protein n=1 Tax=Peribacillus asahii TaxID=228899 RepID=UPI003817F969
MAKFKQRGKTWSYHVYLGIDPLTKKRLEISKGGFKTKKVAQAAARFIKLDKENGTLVKASKLTFAQFSDDWLKTYSRSGVKISSVRAGEKEAKHFISVWGPYQLSQITKRCIRTVC